MPLRPTRDEKAHPLYAAQSHARKQEKRVAERLGGRTVPGSGSGAVKGDVRLTGVLRLENKCTTKDAFRITRSMLEKIENAALQTGEVPAIQVEFIDEESRRILHTVAVVPEYVLDWLVQTARMNNAE